VNIQFIPLRLHAAADYLVGPSFFGVPLFSDFPQTAHVIAWGVAVIHFTMTVLTDYPGGWVKWIPLCCHLLVELVLGPLLVAAPWLFGFADHRIALVLFTVWGFISFVTYFVTDREEFGLAVGQSRT
jgi:hypothetical protein